MENKIKNVVETEQNKANDTIEKCTIKKRYTKQRRHLDASVIDVFMESE